MAVGPVFKNMKKNKILLIGAGQLGSRHLQGLANYKEELHISIVEPNSNNQAIAVQRFQEVHNHNLHKLIIHNTLNDINNCSFDISIIATNADIRATITKQLLTNNLVENIIFEKVAFQNERQFLEIIELLNSKHIKGWVNCPRRNYEFYKELKNDLLNIGRIRMEVEGIDWGLASNSIHFLDLLSFLTGEVVFYPQQIDLINDYFESTRKGFIDFFGSITGNSKAGHDFSFKSTQRNSSNEPRYFIIKIISDKRKLLIDEINKSVRLYEDNNVTDSMMLNIHVPFQSTLTNIQIEEILKKDYSSLPTIEDSFQLHKPLLSIFTKHYGKIINQKVEYLPIT